MIIEDCLKDEKQFLFTMLQFFEKTKYEVMVTIVKERIKIVEQKINQLPEPVY